MLTPLVRDHLSVATGVAFTDSQSVDGSRSLNYIASVRPTFRFERLEISPFYNTYLQRNALTRPIITTNARIFRL